MRASLRVRGADQADLDPVSLLLSPQHMRTLCIMHMHRTMAADKVVAYVKGDPKTSTLGDCEHAALAVAVAGRWLGGLNACAAQQAATSPVPPYAFRCPACIHSSHRFQPLHTTPYTRTTTTNISPGPFCHRVLLTLETKRVPYDASYVDFAAKPDWLVEKFEGKVPVISRGDDVMMADSDKIVVWLEEQYPEPEMASTPPDA